MNMAKRVKQPEQPHVPPPNEVYFFPIKNPFLITPVPYENKLPINQIIKFKNLLQDVQTKKFIGRNTRIVKG